MQSGLPFDLKISNLATDGIIIGRAREAAESPRPRSDTRQPRANAVFATVPRNSARRTADWSMIS